MKGKWLSKSQPALLVRIDIYHVSPTIRSFFIFFLITLFQFCFYQHCGPIIIFWGVSSDIMFTVYVNTGYIHNIERLASVLALSHSKKRYSFPSLYYNSYNLVRTILGFSFFVSHSWFLFITFFRLFCEKEEREALAYLDPPTTCLGADKRWYLARATLRVRRCPNYLRKRNVIFTITL